MGQFSYEPRRACVCGGPLTESNSRVVRPFAWGDVHFLRCAACGSWCQSPQITRGSLAAWFDSPDYRGSADRAGVAYDDYLGDEEPRRVEAVERYQVDLAPRLRPGARVLEVGCATGSLLATLRDHGCEVMGIDLSATFARAARDRYGLEVVVGDLMDVPLARAGFDAVLLFGTVSNLPDLVAALARIRAALAPDGFVAFNLPVADALAVRWLYRSRCWMFTPSACSFMTLEGCRRALARAELRAIDVRRDRQRPSVAKLLTHAGFRWALPAIRRLGLDSRPLPIRFPVPAVRLVMAEHAT